MLTVDTASGVPGHRAPRPVVEVLRDEKGHAQTQNQKERAKIVQVLDLPKKRQAAQIKHVQTVSKYILYCHLSLHRTPS